MSPTSVTQLGAALALSTLGKIEWESTKVEALLSTKQLSGRLGIIKGEKVKWSSTKVEVLNSTMATKAATKLWYQVGDIK